MDAKDAFSTMGVQWGTNLSQTLEWRLKQVFSRAARCLLKNLTLFAAGSIQQ